MNVELFRQYKEKATIGWLIITDHGEKLGDWVTLELPWKDNKRNISCIPEGIYKAKKRVNKKFGEHIHITSVPGRTWILIHPANFTRQLRGCIAPGLTHDDINNDGVMDVTNSRKAMDQILKIVPDEFQITIT